MTSHIRQSVIKQYLHVTSVCVQYFKDDASQSASWQNNYKSNGSSIVEWDSYDRKLWLAIC